MGAGLQGRPRPEALPGRDRLRGRLRELLQPADHHREPVRRYDGVVRKRDRPDPGRDGQPADRTDVLQPGRGDDPGHRYRRPLPGLGGRIGQGHLLLHRPDEPGGGHR